MTPYDAACRPRSLGVLITQVARQWRRAIRSQLRPFALSESNWRTLVHLARADEPVSRSELAAALSLDSFGMLRVLQNLEAGGLVAQVAGGPAHGTRSVVITDDGRKIARRVQRVSEELERELLEQMPEADAAAARKFLESADDLLKLREEGEGRGQTSSR